MQTINLFSPITFKSITIKNRIAVSPMCQYSSQKGFANHWHLVHLGTRAIGGAGLVLTEAAAVLPEGRISPQDLGIWSDDHIQPLKEIVDFIETHGAVAGIQLAHAGRKASTKRSWDGRGMVTLEEGGWSTVAHSALPFSHDSATPRELSIADIKEAIIAFTEAASRAYQAGFKVLEIHSAHGYLLHEFLSPIANQRTDQYGGSFENRIRFLLEIIDAIKIVWPETLPVFVRISATDWVDSGWDLDESIKLAIHLKDKGIDLIDTSSGGMVQNAHIPSGSGYQTMFAERIRQRTGIATGAVGEITSPSQADHIIRTGQADIVLLGREMLRNPYWPLSAAKELGHSVIWPAQYLRAQ
jgi:2,4-dienoyl-CoA reductase-like NADH-dependent reductase (Old Yellow Enzyme family)